MFVGKPLSAVAGLILLVMLSRNLAPEEYGAYFAVLAISEILILASNFGLMPAAYRYISATENFAGKILPKGPIGPFLLLRLISLLLAAVLLLSVPKSIIEPFSNVLADNQVLVFLAIVVVGEGLSRYLEVIFDSMFCQGRSQITLLLRTLIRLFGIVWLARDGSISFLDVLRVEAIAAIAGAVIGLGLLFKVWFNFFRFSRLGSDEDFDFRRFASFAMPAFLAQLLGLAYGPDALKLILAGTSGGEVLALFGFAFSIAAVVQRYMPASLFAGVFRPIFVAASTRPDSNAVLSDLVSLSVKLNWLILLPAASFIYFAGDPLLARLSGGNYKEGGTVLFLLILGLAAVAFHLTLSMYCLALERSWPPLVATAVSVLCLPLALQFAQMFGANGIAMTFGVSELIWFLACLFFIAKRPQQKPAVDWRGLLVMLVSTFLTLFMFEIVGQVYELVWYVPALAAPLIFYVSTFSLSVFNSREKIWLNSVVPIGRYFRFLN